MIRFPNPRNFVQMFEEAQKLHPDHAKTDGIRIACYPNGDMIIQLFNGDVWKDIYEVDEE